MKNMLAGMRLQPGTRQAQPLLLFLMGLGFVALGVRTYPAFVVVGVLFLIIGYRGYTYVRNQRR